MHRLNYLPFLVTLCLLPVQAQPLRFNFVNKDMNTVLSLLVDKYQMPIVYPASLEESIYITTKCDSCQPEEALNKITNGTPFEWKRVGNQYVIARQSDVNGSVEGRVVQDNNKPSLKFLIEFAQSSDSKPGQNRYRQVIDMNGSFAFGELLPGLYYIRATPFQQPAMDWTAVEIQPNSVTRLTINWQPVSALEIPLANVVVTTNRHALLGSVSGVPLIMSREEIAQTPNLRGDVLKLPENLPGVSGSDIYSEVRIRGGDGQDVLVMIDGIELSAPLHFSAGELGLFSVIHSDSLKQIELLSGVFPVEFGNKMGGALKFETASADVGRRSTFESNFLSMKFRTEGTFDDDLGNYSLSARHGFLDIIFGFDDNQNGSTNDINFDDVLGRIQYVFAGHVLTAAYLWTQSKLDIHEPRFLGNRDEFEQISMQGSSYQTWLRLASIWTPDLSSVTTVSTSANSFDTYTEDNFNSIQYEYADQRSFSNIRLRQDWSYSLNSTHFLKWGFSWREADATIDYRHQRNGQTFLGSIDSSISYENRTSSTEIGFYAADRIRFSRRFVAELGLRSDRQSHTNDSQWSPRAHVVFSPTPTSELKMGWGIFHQAQELGDLQIGDGEVDYTKAEHAEKIDFSFQQLLHNEVRLSLAIYQQEITHQYPRYFNFVNRFTLAGQLFPDRVGLDFEKTNSRGIELLIQRAGTNLSWMANYVYSTAEAEVDQEIIPLPWDQRHAFKLSLNYRRGQRWHTGMAWFWHTGWRTTDVDVQESIQPDGSVEANPVVGPYFGEKFPDYHRMDVRIRRQFELRKGKSLSVYLEIINAYNKANISSTGSPYLVPIESGQFRLVFDRSTWIERTPSLGFKLIF